MTIKDLIQDERNANKGTVRGRQMVKQSLEDYGAGRSVLIDKNGRIIAGNKTAEQWAEAGYENVKVVQTDGKTLVAVQRTDLDLNNDSIAKALGVVDNRASEIGLEWDPSVLAELAEETNVKDYFNEADMGRILAAAGDKLISDVEFPEFDGDSSNGAEEEMTEVKFKVPLGDVPIIEGQIDAIMEKFNIKDKGQSLVKMCVILSKLTDQIE